MTKPTQDKETLREAVARAVCPLVLATTEYYNEVPPEEVFSRPRYSFLKDACLFVTDAAIATMLERLRNLPNEMADSIAKKHFVSFEVAKLIGRDIATAFQQENSDAATDR